MLCLQKVTLSVDKATDPKTKTDKENNLHFKGNETRDEHFQKIPCTLLECIECKVC